MKKHVLLTFIHTFVNFGYIYNHVIKTIQLQQE